MKKFSGFFLLSAMFAVCVAAVTARAQAPQAPVALRSAARFALLAGTTITNTGGGVITGDVGVSPGTTFVQGAATVNGAIHLGDPTAAQAQADLSTAFNDAAGRAVPTVVAGNIGGQTLAPGLYKSTSSLAISSGDLTLDAQGNPNAVFIFQIASTLTTTSGRQVILAGGANAANIFWQVGSSATLGTTSLFRGNILAAVSITVNTGATLVGRALAQSGAVTLDTSGGGSTTVPVRPVVNQAGTVNAGSFVAPVAAGSIASVFGSDLALEGATAATGTPLPTALGGTSIRIGAGGAPLFFVSPLQVNLQIPWELAGQAQAPVIATVGGVASSQQTVTLAPFAPGIFASNQAGSGQGAILLAGTAQLAAPGTPAARGGFISIFCTGLGAVTNQPATGAAAQANPLSVTLTTPTVSIGGVVAGLSYSGLAPGYAGLYQVNAQVPAGTSTGNAVPVVISVGNATSNTVTIAVQ